MGSQSLFCGGCTGFQITHNHVSLFLGLGPRSEAGLVVGLQSYTVFIGVSVIKKIGDHWSRGLKHVSGFKTFLKPNPGIPRNPGLPIEISAAKYNLSALHFPHPNSYGCFKVNPISCFRICAIYLPHNAHIVNLKDMRSISFLISYDILIFFLIILSSWTSAIRGGTSILL